VKFLKKHIKTPIHKDLAGQGTPSEHNIPSQHKSACKKKQKWENQNVRDQ